MCTECVKLVVTRVVAKISPEAFWRKWVFFARARAVRRERDATRNVARVRALRTVRCTCSWPCTVSRVSRVRGVGAHGGVRGATPHSRELGECGMWGLMGLVIW